MPPASSDRPDVSILIVGFNSAAIIAACINSIPAAATRHSYEVLLVDNGDGSTEAVVAAQFPQVRIVPSKGNIGFAGGNNLLAAEARGRYLLLLNPDVEMKPEALDRLMEAAAKYSGASAWGGVTLDRDDQPDLGNTVHAPSLKEMASRLLGRSIAATAPLAGIDKDAQVDVLSGSFVMFSRAAWDEVGGLDERYFLYCEEVDLFYRLAQRGHTFWRIAGSRANHDIGHGNAASPRRELYLCAGVVQFTRLHWNSYSAFAGRILIWTLALQRYLLGALFGRRSASLAVLGEKQRLVALRPHYWWHGYDAKRGLLARLPQ
jgi:N-acetylglucosaminyl-diphospho-decaprenol L-rhamnosyltransferase